MSNDRVYANNMYQPSTNNQRYSAMSTPISEEQRINVCKTAVSQIYSMLRRTPHEWRNFLGLARTVISHIDATSFMQLSTETTEQAWMLAALQRLAFMDADNGAVVDIAAWCTKHWLVIHQWDPQNLAALSFCCR